MLSNLVRNFLRRYPRDSPDDTVSRLALVALLDVSGYLFHRGSGSGIGGIGWIGCLVFALEP